MDCDLPTVVARSHRILPSLIPYGSTESRRDFLGRSLRLNNDPIFSSVTPPVVSRLFPTEASSGLVVSGGQQVADCHCPLHIHPREWDSVYGRSEASYLVGQHKSAPSTGSAGKLLLGIEVLLLPTVPCSVVYTNFQFRCGGGTGSSQVHRNKLDKLAVSPNPQKTAH